MDWKHVMFVVYLEMCLKMKSFTETFFLCNSTTCPYGLPGPPSWLWPKCYRLLRLVCPQGRLHCIDDVSDDDMDMHGVPAGALNPSYTSCRDHGRYGDLPVQGKIPTAELGIETRTSWLVVRSSDHQAMMMIILLKLPVLNSPPCPGHFKRSLIEENRCAPFTM
jgi:hypothetical protein